MLGEQKKLQSRMLNFAAVILICFPVIAKSCAYEVYKGSKICADGKEIWTVGYGNRSLKAVVECRNGGAQNLWEEFMWCRGYPYCTYSALFINRDYPNVSARWTAMNNTHLVSELKFNDVVGYSEQSWFLNLRMISNTTPSHLWNISIEYCPRENRNGVSILDLGGNSTYGNRGKFLCSINHYLVDIVVKKLVTNATTICGACAQWEGIEKVDCWRVPNVSLNQSAVNRRYTTGEQLTSEICNVLDYGKPNASVKLSRNNLELQTPFTLRPEHNNMTVYCNAQNKLTQILNDGGKFSEPYTLVVEFGPTGFSEWTRCTSNDPESGLYNVTLHMLLSANPPVDKPNVFVNDKKKNIALKLNNGSVGCCGVRVQTFDISLINVTKGNTVTIVFNHKIKNLARIRDAITGNCSVSTEATPTTSSITSFESTTKPMESAKLSETTIGVICSAVVIVLVLIAGFLTLHLRKRSVTGESSSSRPDQPSVVEMTVDPVQADSSKPENNETEGYEISIIHTYEKMKPVKNGRAYENVGGALNPGFDENTAYEL